MPFELRGSAERLFAGHELAVEGAFLGRPVGFRVEASTERTAPGLSLRASGAFDIDVDYQIDAQH